MEWSPSVTAQERIDGRDRVAPEIVLCVQGLHGKAQRPYQILARNIPQTDFTAANRPNGLHVVRLSELASWEKARPETICSEEVCFLIPRDTLVFRV